MEIFLVVLGLIFMILGIIGAFLPILPGPITGWVGLLILHFTETIPQNWTFLGVTLFIAVLIYVLDYIIPAIGTKKFGGSKYGMYGTTAGLLIGLIFFPPFGIVVGPFAGAFLGELMFDSKDSSRALKAAFGSFIGFLFSTGLKFITGVIYLGLYLSIVWDFRSSFF